MNFQSQRANNGNGNDNFQNENTNANETMSKKNDYSTERSKTIDTTAYQLCEIFDNDPKNIDGTMSNIFKFYCKAAWRLQPSVIWSNVEEAKKGRNPGGLFVYLCKKHLGIK